MLARIEEDANKSIKTGIIKPTCAVRAALTKGESTISKNGVEDDGNR
jgi:hypothetical protein